MGNAQSESTQESETSKDGEEKANPDRKEPSWGLCGARPEARHRSPGPGRIGPKDASRAQSKEPGGVDRQTGAVEMGKSNSKKSKLKFSSMWSQNLSSGGIKETSLGERVPVTERQGPACPGRADLQRGQSPGFILPGEEGPKATFKPPQGVAYDQRGLGTRKEAAKGKSKAENSGPLLQPENLMASGPTRDAVETQVSPKEYPEHRGRLPNSVPSPQKQPEGTILCPEPLGTPKFLSKQNINRPVPSCAVAPPGGKKVLLPWRTGEKQQEKGQAGQQDSAPGSDGDSKGPALASQLLAEQTIPSNPVEKPPTLGSDAKAERNNEALGVEVAGPEAMQEMLDRGFNFLYEVTIQPGQWPPSLKSVKQKAGLVLPGASYADILKQCPQKKVTAGAPAPPKAAHQPRTAEKKTPSFKGLEKSNPKECSPLRRVFLEHFKKVPLKEPTGQVPCRVITFLEQKSPDDSKRPEWQRPRSPTPHPSRRKGRSRKLRSSDAAACQVATLMGSDSKSDWPVHDETQMSLDDAEVAAEGSGEQPSAGEQEVEARGSPLSIPAVLPEQSITEEVDGAKEAGALKRLPCKWTQSILSSPATVPSSQTEEQPPMTRPAPKSHSLCKTPALSPPMGSVPGGLTAGAVSEQKAPAAVRVRPKVRKQGPAAAVKSREKIKSSGQPKTNVHKGKGQKQRPHSCGVTSPLKLEQRPLFTPLEEIPQPFYFGEPLGTPFSHEDPAATKEEEPAPSQDGQEQDPEIVPSTGHSRWPPFQMVNSCSRKCSCRHQGERKLPKNVEAWLNPSANYLAEPPWVATALLAASLVAGTKFCQDSFRQQHLTHKD